MIKLFGIIFVASCVFGGFVLAGGKLVVLWQPIEFLIILGSAAGGYLIANSPHTLKVTGSKVGAMFKAPKYQKEHFLELLTLLFAVFKTARTKGWLALEKHIEEPGESDLFNQFPGFQKDHHAVTFLCDYLRIISLGAENPHELEALIDQELEVQKEEREHVSHAVQNLADGVPALGIVAAVLGVILTMGSISEPPEVLGKLIGAALVGTFAGVFFAYGFFGPMANALGAREEEEMQYYICMKVSLLAFLQGAAPQVAIEFGRKVLGHEVQPTFLEVEEATQNVTLPG